MAAWIEAVKKMKKVEALPRVELGLLDSESNVITTTLQRPIRLCQDVDFHSI